MADQLDQSEEEALAERIFRNKLAIKELVEENQTLLTYFKDRPGSYPAGARTKLGAFTVLVAKSTRISDDLAKEKLPQALYERVSKRKVDSVTAKKILTGSQYESISKVYENRIEIDLA